MKQTFLIVGYLCLLFSAPLNAAEVVVLSSVDEHIEWLKSQNWWGEVERGDQLVAPHALMTGISKNWGREAAKLPVPVKKELFYRYLAPLILHANKMVMQRRERLAVMSQTLKDGLSLASEDLAWLKQAAPLLRIINQEEASALAPTGDRTAEVVSQALYKLDIIPPGLALGQAAYESGYGTSRFAVQGNALFGQWTFGGEGLKPEQQRRELGDHRIAAFDWPFDSVRGYFINLSSHPAYEPFRKLRAELRARGESLSSMVLADGLRSYSERGQAYVDTLKSIIRVNKLDIADAAKLRDEPLRFVVGAESEADAAAIRSEIETLRNTGELAEIISRMRLE